MVISLIWVQWLLCTAGGSVFISGDSSLFSLKFQTYHFNAADGMQMGCYDCFVVSAVTYDCYVVPDVTHR